jgi:hypothetical protein
LRREALVAVTACDPERVPAMLALYLFDRNMSYGTRLEVSGRGGCVACICTDSGVPPAWMPMLF